MADVAGITDVKPATTNTVSRHVVYGSTVVPGNLLYLDTTDNKYKLADADVSETTAGASAIAVTPGSDTDNGIVITSGSVILVGATLTIGGAYVVSATAGAIAPEADLTTNDYVTRIGTAATTTRLDLTFTATGIQHP